MRLRHFVSASAIILCGWLAVTFVTEVPVKRYPKLEKQVLQESPTVSEEAAQFAKTTANPAEIIRVSVSP